MIPKTQSTHPEISRSLLTATRMIDAVGYLADVASRAGLLRIAIKLKTVKRDLLLTVKNGDIEFKEKDSNFRSDEECNFKKQH